MKDSDVKIGMVCRDLEGDEVVIDRWHDHKRVECGIKIGDRVFFEGDRFRVDELTPTGEMYTPPAA